MNIPLRELVENSETILLAPHATFSKYSKGRDRKEPECPIRTCFQRDRDRIIHSDAFQREKDKTQVITTIFTKDSDTYRTRLTHSLEVSQIGRVIAQSLKLNQDLVEAACLGHDLGHTPFGHKGEETLNKRYSFGFNHAIQSVRVVEKLEKNGKGLNLTKEVREAIRNHSGLSNNMVGVTPETKLLPFADKIAYLTSDLNDAIKYGVIKISDIPSEITDYLGDTKTQIINSLTKGLIKGSYGTMDVKMEDRTFDKMAKLRKWMFKNVYESETMNKSREEIGYIINFLCHYYEKNPKQMKFISEPSDLYRSVCDYVASMTDTVALDLFQTLNKSYTIIRKQPSI